MTKTPPFVSGELLKKPGVIQHYMDEALATGDPAFITHALGAVARAKSMTQNRTCAGKSLSSAIRWRPR
jgi:probable addiction module antidote protein